jgi:branched-chain amino acid transport system permease protein
MDPQITLFLHTFLNGLQFGVFLFLVAAGLTLVLGIMNMVNLAHGSLFMLGAFYAAFLGQALDSFFLAILLAIPLSLLTGILLEIVALRTLYARDHLDQVLATFGLILFFNELVILVFGVQPQRFQVPEWLNGNLPLFGAPYPLYRLIIIGVGLAIAVGLYLFISKTKVGMLIRAGASNRTMAGALGVNISILFTIIFGIGAALAGFSGIMAGPIESVEPGIGEAKLILAFVVIVIGGIGSIRGAFVAAILIGLIEMTGRTFLKDILAIVLDAEFAQTAGPALASMLIYVLMAVVLIFKPQGLFPARTG